jgi:hypothetical protein
MYCLILFGGIVLIIRGLFWFCEDEKPKGEEHDYDDYDSLPPDRSGNRRPPFLR